MLHPKKKLNGNEQVNNNNNSAKNPSKQTVMALYRLNEVKQAANKQTEIYKTTV